MPFYDYYDLHFPVYVSPTKGTNTTVFTCTHSYVVLLPNLVDENLGMLATLVRGSHCSGHEPAQP